MAQTGRQVAEQAKTHVGRDALAAGQEAIHLGQTLVEAGAVLSQDSGVRAERGCGGSRGQVVGSRGSDPALLPAPPPAAAARASPVTCTRRKLCRCLTVISRMSAFSSFEWRELWGQGRYGRLAVQ